MNAEKRPGLIRAKRHRRAKNKVARATRQKARRRESK